MKGIVIYESRYGAAKQYAGWIAESLGIPLIKSKDVTTEQIKHSDYVIAGASIYIGKILLKGWLDRNGQVLLKKKLFVFIVGAAPMEDKAKTTKYFSDNLPPGLIKHAKCFYFRGKSLMRELSWWDRLLLKMGAKFAKGERDRKEMLTEFNAVERGNTHELIKAVKESLGT